MAPTGRRLAWRHPHPYTDAWARAFLFLEFHLGTRCRSCSRRGFLFALFAGPLAARLVTRGDLWPWWARRLPCKQHREAP